VKTGSNNTGGRVMGSKGRKNVKKPKGGVKGKAAPDKKK
jgi:hypothetical protein